MNLSFGPLGTRTYIRHCTLRGMIASYPAIARACHSDVSSNDLEKLFKGNQDYRYYLSSRHPKLLEDLAMKGQSE